MPDQFGNPTPQEILAQISAEQDAMLSRATTPYQTRLANLYALGRAVTSGLDPRLVSAKNIQDALSKTNDFKRMENESALDFEIRRGRQMFEDVKMVDPPTAADISAKLIELEGERAEQDRLKERFGWEREQHVQAVQKHKSWDLTEGLFYEVDPNTGKTTGVSTSVNEATHSLTVNEVRERGNLLITADDASALRLDTANADLKLLNNSDFSQMLGQVAGAMEAGIVARDLASLYVEAGEEGMNPTTATDRVYRVGNSVLQSINEMRRSLGLIEAPSIGTPEFAADQSVIEAELRRRGIQTAVPAALLTLYTYSVARSVDPRVTEQDFRNFSSILGGTSGSPEQIMSTMRQQLLGRHETLLRTIGDLTTTFEEAPEGTIARTQGKALRSQLNELTTVMSEFEQPFRKLMTGTGSQVPGEHPRKPPTANTVRVGGRTLRMRQGE